jgi:hypothetical protein
MKFSRGDALMVFACGNNLARTKRRKNAILWLPSQDQAAIDGKSAGMS